MSSPFHVEFLTWNTSLDRAQGLGAGIDSLAQGHNLGHASVEMSLPYSEVTQQWIEQYCQNIPLYKPPEGFQRVEDEYVANIPVYYTTAAGKRVYNPKKYQQEHPQETIVTHVYLSWVPDDYAPQRDYRDPFWGNGKRSFGLYDRDQDKIMEYVGQDVSFLRGYQGPQRMELQQGELPDSTKYINRGIRKMHQMTQREIALMEMTPKQRFLADTMINEIYNDLKEYDEPNRYLNELKNHVKSLVADKGQNFLLKDAIDDIAQQYQLVDEMGELFIKIYCYDNNIDYDSLDEEQEETINEKFENEVSLKGFEATIEMMQAVYDKLALVSEDRLLQWIKPVYESIAESEQSLQELLDGYSVIKNKVTRLDADLIEAKQQNNTPEKTRIIRERKRVVDEVYQQNPCLEILFQRYADFSNSADNKKNRWEFLCNDPDKMVETALKLEDELLLRKHEKHVASEAGCRVILPIANIDEADFKEGHPEGLHALEMLKAIPKLVADGQGYALHYKNCSDVVQALGQAGAPDNLKHVFDRYALGMEVTPQVVANSALQYENIIYDVNYQPGQYKQSAVSKFYQNIERTAANNQKKYQILSERIGAQDQWVDCILNNMAQYKENRLLNKDPLSYEEALYQKVVKSEHHNDYMSEKALKKRMGQLYKKTHEKTKLSKTADINRQFEKKEGAVYDAAVTAQLKDSIYAYANQEYRQALKADKERVYRDIDNQTGVFAWVAQQDSKPLADQAIKDEMRKITHSTTNLTNEFNNKGEIYKHACHRIIYQHAPSVENLMNPNFVSMEQDRKDLKKYRNAMITKVFQLVLMRSLYTLVRTPENVDSIWHEVDFARRATAYGVTMVPDGPANVFAQVARYSVLAGLTAVHALLVAPRRAASKLLKNIRANVFSPGKKTLAKQSKEQRFLDTKFETKLTSDAATQQNMIRYKALTENLVRGDQAVVIKAKDGHHALQQANALIAQQKIPCFSHKTECRVLKKIAKVDRVLSKVERKENQLFSSKLNHQLDQFERATKIKLGELECRDFSDTFNYQPDIHGPVIPKDIQETLDANKIRTFFKARIEEYHGAVVFDSDNDPVPLVNEDIDFLTSQAIDQMSDKQLFTVVRRMSGSDLVTQLKIHEKQLLDELMNHPQSTLFEFKPNQPDEFKAYLKDKGWKTSLLEVIESKGLFPNVLSRLQYAQVSALSVNKIIRLAKEQEPQDAQQSQSGTSRAKPIAHGQKQKDSAAPQRAMDIDSAQEHEHDRSSEHRPMK